MDRSRKGRRIFRADPAREVEEELSFHVAMRTRELMAGGVSEADARERALQRFGSVETARDECLTIAARRRKSMDRGEYIQEMVRAARHAGRSLLRSPVLTLTIIATVGISVAAGTAIFSVVDAVLLRALPYEQPDRLAWIESVRVDRPDAPFSLPEFMDLGERARTVDLAAYGNWSATFATTESTVRLQGMRVSANVFDVLGASPSAGRLLQPADDLPEAARVTVLSYSFWQRQFGSSSSVIGEVIRLNGEPYTIVGVLPRHFPWPLRGVDVVVPLSPEADPRRHARNSVNFLRFVGRIDAAASSNSAQLELTDLTQELRRQFPAEYARKAGVRVSSFHEHMVGEFRQTLILLLTSVGLLFGIAFANVLNLWLIRATARQREIAVRRALGASTGTIARLHFTEGTLLAFAATVVGLVIAYWAVDLAAASASLNLPRLSEAGIGATALWLVAGLMVVMVAVFGLAPLQVGGRVSAEAALRGSGATRRQDRLWGVFIVAEIALAVVLVSATMTMLESLVRLQRVDLGYRTDSVFVAQLSLPPGKYRQPADVVRFYENLSAQLARQPGVISTGMTSIAPLSGLLSAVPFTIAGDPSTAGRERPSANFRAISPGYFPSIHASMATGRQFTERDNESSPHVAIISSALAARYFPQSNPLGHQLLVDDNDTGPRPVTIVGVVTNLRHVEIEGEPTHDIFIPLRQIHPDGVQFVTNNQFWTMRLATEPSLYGKSFTTALRNVDADVATAGLGSMSMFVDAALSTRRFSVGTLLAFAVVALVLATLGVYGVMAHSVDQRRREIGVRMAVGASTGEIVRLIMGRALGLAAIGIALGLCGALITSRAFAGLLFGITAASPAVLAGVAGLLIATSAAASWIPARRAARIGPAIVISRE